MTHDIGNRGLGLSLEDATLRAWEIVGRDTVKVRPVTSRSQDTKPQPGLLQNRDLTRARLLVPRTETMHIVALWYFSLGLSTIHPCSNSMGSTGAAGWAYHGLTAEEVMYSTLKQRVIGCMSHHCFRSHCVSHQGSHHFVAGTNN